MFYITFVYYTVDFYIQDFLELLFRDWGRIMMKNFEKKRLNSDSDEQS